MTADPDRAEPPPQASEVPTLLGQLSRRPPDERRAAIEDLGGRLGNRELARMVAREQVPPPPTE